MPSGLAAAQMLLPVAKFRVGGQPVQDWYIATFSPVTSHKQRRMVLYILCCAQGEDSCGSSCIPQQLSGRVACMAFTVLSGSSLMLKFRLLWD